MDGGGGGEGARRRGAYEDRVAVPAERLHNKYTVEALRESRYHGRDHPENTELKSCVERHRWFVNQSARHAAWALLRVSLYIIGSTVYSSHIRLYYYTDGDKKKAV